MPLTAIYHILNKNEPYSAELYRKSDISPVDYTKKAIEFLAKSGFTVTPPIIDLGYKKTAESIYNESAVWNGY